MSHVESILSFPLVFEIPGRPVPGARARVFKRTSGPKAGEYGAATPAKNKAYQKHVATCAWAAARNKGWKIPHKKFALGISLVVYRHVEKGDASNYLKVVEDGVNDSKAVWVDDRCVDFAAVRVITNKSERLRIDVKIWVLEEGST